MKFLKTEILKNIRLKHWQILLLLCIVVSFLKAYDFCINSSTPYLIEKADPVFKNAYFVFYQSYFNIINLGFPIIISLLCITSIIFMENKHNMWVFLATRPYYNKIHFSKLAVICLFLTCFLLVSFLSSFIAINLFIDYLPSLYVYNKPTYFSLAGIWFGKFLIGGLGLVGIHYMMILFCPIRNIKLTIAIILPYLLIFLPEIVNPYAFLFNITREAHLFRKAINYEMDFNIFKFQIISVTEYIATASILLTIIIVYSYSKIHKRLL